MKVFILIVSLFITSNFLLAQHTYVPFAKPNKYWFYNVSDGSENIYKNTSSYVLWTKGDTVISGLNYVQMFKSDLRGSHNCPILPCFVPDVPYVLFDTARIGYLRDDSLNQLVYFLPEVTLWETCGYEEMELYNFNLNVGDTISNCFKTLLEKDSPLREFGGVDSIEILNINGKERKVLWIQLPINKGLLYLTPRRLIEGIGLDFYDAIHYNYEHNSFDFCEGDLFECHIASSTKSIGTNELKLFPSPTNGIVKLDRIYEVKEARIIDISGRSKLIKVLYNEIDISSYQAGVYYLVLTDRNNHQYFNKIVKL